MEFDDGSAQVRNVRGPGQQTAKEHQEHMTRRRPHRRSNVQDDVDGMLHVSMDYEFHGERNSEEQTSPVLVVRERRHKMGDAGSKEGDRVPLDRRESSKIHRSARTQQGHAQMRQ